MQKEAQATKKVVKLNKTLKGKIKTPGSKTVAKNSKSKIRRNTVSHDEKSSSTLTSAPSEEFKQQTKTKTSVNLTDIRRRTQSMSKTNAKIYRKMSDSSSS
jgi:hypothetical protein